MKAKFTLVKPSEKAWFIARLSQLCLFSDILLQQDNMYSFRNGQSTLCFL